MSTVVYIKPRCPYCASARQALRQAGEDFEERDASADPAAREELMRLTGGDGMVPVIVRAGDPPAVQVGFPPGQG